MSDAPVTIAQDSPAQVWISDWTDFLSEHLPLIFPVVVLLAGTLLIARAQGGVGKLIGFGVGAAVVFLLLTNLEAVSAFFSEELPLPEVTPPPVE